MHILYVLCPKENLNLGERERKRKRKRKINEGNDHVALAMKGDVRRDVGTRVRGELIMLLLR